MLLYLLRHGRTDYNDQGLVQGHLDIPLNDHGRNQIERLARHCELVPFNRIYTSTLSRAVESAEIIAHHHAHGEVVLDNALRDRHYGSLEGTLWDDDDEHLIPEDAESQASLKSRLQGWLSTLITNHTPSTSPINSPISPNTSKADVVLVVTHEECLLTLLDLLTTHSGGHGGVEVDVATGVDVERRVDNGRFCIVRVWWDGEDARGRIEGWGVGGLLQD